MMKLFTRPLLGIDLGSRTLKGVRLKKRKGRIALDNYFFVDLAEPTEGFTRDADMNQLLREAVEDRALQDTRFSTGLPDREVMHVDLELPSLPAAELRTAVQHELSEHLGLAADDLAFDFFCEAGSPPAKGAEKSLKIRAYGAARKMLADRLSPLTAASLRAQSAEPDALAVISMLDFNDYILSDRTYAIFDMGENHQTASLVINGELRLSKTTELGWGAINQALREKLDLPYAAADEYKFRYDFSGSDQNQPQIDQIIDEVYALIFSDVRRTLDLFREALPSGMNIDQAILVGGGSQARNIERVFQMFFRIPAVVANPFRNIDIFPEGSHGLENIAEIAPYLATSVGLALNGMMPERAKKCA